MTVTDTADFRSGENTNGWHRTAVGWVSPVYPAPVATVSVAGTNLADGAELNVASSGNTFTVTLAGGAALESFTALYTTTRLPPSNGLQVTNVIDCGFTAYWAPVADAVGYRLNFYSNVLEGVSAGAEVFAERFSRVPSRGNATALDVSTFNDSTDTQAGWTFDTCYYAISPVSNAVQIGNTAKDGWLALPVPDKVYGSGYTLEFSAARFADSGVDMPVSVVSQTGITNWIGSVPLSVNPTVFHLELPALSATDAIFFHSTTNKKDARVLLSSVRILDGYSAGSEQEILYGSVLVNGTAFVTNGMQAINGKVSVTALAAAEKDDSDESERVELKLADPPLMPILRACPIGTATYETDFAELAAVTANRTPWYNGVSPLAYWMCCRDNGSIVEEIGVGTTNTSTSGLFRFHDNWYGYGEALGWRGNSERDFFTGIAFVNDAPLCSLVNFRLSFRPCQWNWRNSLPMTNTVEYRVSGDLVSTAAGDWTALKALDILPPFTSAASGNGETEWWGEVMAAELTGVVLHPGEYLTIRFTDRHTASSGGVGIAGFKLEFEKRQPSFSLIFR